MNENGIKIRLMKASDFDAVVKMDEKVRKVSRPEYYQVRFERARSIQATICQLLSWLRRKTGRWSALSWASFI